MGKFLQILLVVFLALILQVSLLPNIFPAGFAPNLLLVAIIFLSARTGFEKMWPWALTAGLLSDFFFFLPIGISTASFLAVAFIVGFLTKWLAIIHESLKFLVLAILMIAGTVINSWLVSIFSKIFLYHEPLHSLLFFSILDPAMWKIIAGNLFLFAVIYTLLKKFERLIITR
ncbi:MAG: rod shape-determining protein MreD [Candidatus Moranbacteria bacterium]|nr:rod shape-determining protein MreD [Candidatus Moranbacteria bacterium]